MFFSHRISVRKKKKKKKKGTKMKMMKNEVEEDEEEATSGQVAHFQAALRPNRGGIESRGGTVINQSFVTPTAHDAKG